MAAVYCHMAAVHCHMATCHCHIGNASLPHGKLRRLSSFNVI
jgi:hypothetical protein